MQEQQFKTLIDNIISNRITELNLSHQEISQQEGTTVLEALRKNHSIKTSLWDGAQVSEILKKEIETILQNNKITAAFQAELKKYRDEAEQGDINKQFNLGWIYDVGLLGESACVGEAIKWYTKAANQGNLNAQYNLAVIYYNCYKKDLINDSPIVRVETNNSMMYWAKEVAKQPITDGLGPPSRFLLGYLSEMMGARQKESAEAEKCYRQAVELYQEAAETTNAPRSCYRLSLCYRRGRGTERNDKLADAWLKKSAEMGHTPALTAIGIQYEEIGNKTKAFEYYQKSVLSDDPNHPETLFRIGKCYIDAIGTQNNRKKAIEFFKRGAERGHAGAMLFYGVTLREYGRRALWDKSSVYWFRKAAKTEENEFSKYAECALVDYLLIANFLKESDERCLENLSEAREGLDWWFRLIDRGCPIKDVFNLGIGMHFGYDSTLFSLEAMEELFEVFKSRGAFAELNVHITLEELKIRYHKKGGATKEFPAFEEEKLWTFPSGTPESALQDATKHNEYSRYKTYITFPCLNVFRENGKALLITLGRGYFDFAKKLLLTEKIDVNLIGTKQKTALELAIDASQPDIVELLVHKAGLDINLHFPLLKASAADEERIVQLLCSANTIPPVEVNVTETLGSETALWIAAKHGNLLNVQTFLAHKDIKVDYRCSKLSKEELEGHAQLGKTRLNAQEIAAFYGHDEVVMAIQNYNEKLIKNQRDEASKRRKAAWQDVQGTAAIGSSASALTSNENNQASNLVNAENTQSERLSILEQEIKSLREENILQQRQLQEQAALHNQQMKNMKKQMDDLFTIFKSTQNSQALPSSSAITTTSTQKAANQ